MFYNVLGGGGGAGGLIYTNNFFVDAGTYTVVVGGGGTGAKLRNTRGGNGTNSVFGTLTAIGGGGGGSYNSTTAGSGGSGGGTQGTSQFGTGVSGQGHDGAGSSSGTIGGGGGGAGESGEYGVSAKAGDGGDGLAYDISGTMTYYAGGGGGGHDSPGLGGLGGGGDGAARTGDGTPGAPNTGGGGGGIREASSALYHGGDGGSDIVIVRYVLDDRGATATGEASDITETSATLSGILVSVGDPAADIVMYYGTSNGGDSATSWDTGITLPAPQPLGDFTVPVSGLLADQTYYFRAAASNEAGIGWASDTGFFITGGVQVEKTADANEEGLVPGTFRLYRPSSTTGEATTVYFELGGSATGGVDYVEVPLYAEIPAGETETTVTITPISNWSLLEDTTVTLAIQPGLYPVGTTSSANMTIYNQDMPVDKNVWVAPAAGNASVAANWSLNRAPTADDDILVSGYSTADMLWDSSATDVVASWTQDSGYTGTVTFNTVYGETGFTNFTVTGDAVINGGSLTHTRNYMNEVYRLAMTINGNLTVDGGVIHANDGGFNTSAGPGASPNLYGGSHGGKGGDFYRNGTIGSTYGNALLPTTIGSGGGGGKGGGAIRLVVGGTTAVAAGSSISAEPSTGSQGGGSGGSVYLTTSTLAGDGEIRANGYSTATVSSTRGGGGGGRVFVELTAAGADFTQWSGVISAYGGASSEASRHGTCGTVYLKTQSGDETLVVDNNGMTTYDYIITELPEQPALDLTGIDKIQIAGGGVLGVPATAALDFGTQTITSEGDNSAIDIMADDNVSFPAYWNLTNLTVRGSGITKPLNNLVIGTGGCMSHRYNIADETDILKLTILGNLVLENGGSIDVTGKGYANGQGPGTGSGLYYGGAYGGGGGGYVRTPLETSYSFPNTNTYGAIIRPQNIGSGGHSSHGGGAVLLSVAGTTSVDTQSRITADGGKGFGGSGSGGTVYITTASLSGSGTISANGGTELDISTRGAGGGGRISVVLTGSGSDFSEWTGSFKARSGSVEPSNPAKGAAGTVYLEAVADKSGGGTVAVDNETLSNEMSLKPWTPIPAFAGSTEVIKDTRWSAKNQTKLRVVADTIIGELVIEPPVELDLAGNSLTLKLFSLDGMATTIPADTYTAADLASALVVDSIGGGTVTVLPSSTLIILR